MGKLLDKIGADLNAVGYKRRSAEARAWLRSEAQKLGQINRADIIRDSYRASSVYVGNMFFMIYDPKTKDQLPYWDKFPLVLPIEMYGDGFLGLNFHYLPLNLRVKLLDSLYDLTNNNRFDETTRFKASYSLLSGAARFKAFEPCIKRYLSSHIQSRMIAIEPDKWDIAIFLQTQNFQKASAQKVWTDSRNIIDGAVTPSIRHAGE